MRSFLLSVSISAVLSQAQTAEGFVKIGAVRHEIRYSRAARIADDFNPSRQMIHVLLSESPVPPKALFDDLVLFRTRREDPGILIELNFRKTNIGWFLSGKGIEGLRSLGEGPDGFPYQLSEDGIKGKIVSKSEAGDPAPYEVAVTFSTSLEKLATAPVPTSDDSLAAQNHPAAKAFLAYEAAIRSGDKATVRAMLPLERRDEFDKHSDEILKVLRSMQPSDTKVLTAVELNGKVTLTISGKMDGNVTNGEVTMKLEKGHWSFAMPGSQ